MFKLLSVALIALMSTFIKLLGRNVPIGETVFVRGVIALLVLGSIAHYTTGLQVLKTSNWRGHAIRSLAGTASMFCYFASLSMIPLADYTAITFASPIFITILAMIFLGERIHVFRWTALIVGLLGVIIIIAPQLSSQHGNALGSVMALCGAISGAVAITTLRSMSKTEAAITITFYFLMTAMACAIITALLGWVLPNKQQAVWMLLAGLCGVLGQLSMTTGYKYAEASTLAPLDYTAMIMAVAIGYFVFSEVPGLWIWVGSALVISAGLVIIWREFQLHKPITTVR